MRYNNYQSNNYRSRRQVRGRQYRYREKESKGRGKNFIEEFLTQFVVCFVIMILVFGTKFIGFNRFDKTIDKFKTAIMYSPSIHEIKSDVKDAVSIVIRNINYNYDNKDQESVPDIIIDDEVF